MELVSPGERGGEEDVDGQMGMMTARRSWG